MKNLEELLVFLEENIDQEHIENVEKLHTDALGYKDIPCLPLVLIAPVNALTSYTYEEAFYDPEKMMWNELLKTVGGTSTYNSVLCKDHFPLQIRSNHGIGIISSLFGAKCRIIGNNLPWVDHLEMKQIKEVVEKGVPEMKKALGKRVFEAHEYYMERLKPYPKCARYIRITQPDLQGPFDIAHLLIGDDVFFGPYDYAELLHELLAVITETYIGYIKEIQPYVTDKADTDAIYLHGAIYGGKALIKDDTALAMLSEEMYREFSKEYNDRISEALGGASVHYCGNSRDWHLNAIDNAYIKGINYGNPELLDLEEIWRYWSDRKVPNILWGDSLRLQKADIDFIAELDKLNIKTGMTLGIRVDDLEDAKSIMGKYNKNIL